MSEMGKGWVVFIPDSLSLTFIPDLYPFYSSIGLDIQDPSLPRCRQYSQSLSDFKFY